MAVRCIDLKCSNCSYQLEPSMRKCKKCKQPVVITSFNSVLDMTASDLNQFVRELNSDPDATAASDMGNMVKFTQASCYLRLKLYDKALTKFEAAIEDNFDNPETYFYAAVSSLKGKKAFLTPMANIKKAIEYVNAALMVEDRGVFHYFLAYIKFDFYARKYLRISPDWQEELMLAQSRNLSLTDCNMLFDILGVEMPETLRVFNG